jgi:hypothetical protein
MCQHSTVKNWEQFSVSGCVIEDSTSSIVSACVIEDSTSSIVSACVIEDSTSSIVLNYRSLNLLMAETNKFSSKIRPITWIWLQWKLPQKGTKIS